MRAFHRTAGGRYTSRLDKEERGLLLNLLDELAELVAPAPRRPDADPLEALVGLGAEVERPGDAAVLRLFPDGYGQDPGAAADFRRFTEPGLREAKTAGLRVVRDSLVGSGEKLVLSPQQAEAWLTTLNDLRLVLGTRLGVTEDPDQFAGLAEDDPLAVAVAVYEFLGWLQATLVDAMLEATT